MPMRIYVLNGHPAQRSLSHDLAEQYAHAARDAGHEVKTTHLHEIEFDSDFGFGGYTRLGNAPGDRPRPTKVTFASPFDARLFLAKFDNASKSDGAEVGAILKDTRCRPCRSSEEQSRHKLLISQMKQLNKDSKEAGRTSESFSLRNSGEIWKFTKTDNNKWRRDADWVFFSLPTDEARTTTSGDEAASSHVSENLAKKPVARNPSD